MADVNFKIKGKPIREDIINFRDIEIELAFDNPEAKLQVNAGNLEFVAEAHKLIDTWAKNGIQGKEGIYEAVPFTMEGCGTTLIDGGVDLANCETVFECDKTTAPIREAYKMDFLNDRAQSFSFAYLASVGIITQADYVQVPYVINTIPDYTQVLLGCLSLYVLIKELQEAILKTASLITELAGDVTTAAASAGIAIATVIADIVKIGLYLTYIIVMILAMIDLLSMVFQNLIQPLKYKKGIRVSTLFQKACQHLNINFSSTIFASNSIYKDLVIIPKKTALITDTKINFNALKAKFSMKQYDDAKHPKSYGYFEGTFTDLILGMNNVLNAKPTILINAAGKATLHYERIDFFKNQTQYKLPDLEFSPNGTNACELASNYYLTFALDDSETNTYDLYEGTATQMVLSPIAIANQGNVLLKNLDERRLMFARAKEKTTYTAVENIFTDMYNLISSIYSFMTGWANKIIKVINNAIGAVANLFNVTLPTVPTFPAFPPNPMPNRLGAMLLSTDFIGVPKLLIVNSTNHVHTFNEIWTSASFLIDQYHFINFAVYTTDTSGAPKNEHNQWYTYKNKEIPLCCTDFLKIKNNNYIKTSDNKIAKVDSLIWNPYKETAKINFRVKEQWTKNLRNSYLINVN